MRCDELAQKAQRTHPKQFDLRFSLTCSRSDRLSINCHILDTVNRYFKMTSISAQMAISICSRSISTPKKLLCCCFFAIFSMNEPHIQAQAEKKWVPMNISAAVKHLCWIRPAVSGRQKSNRQPIRSELILLLLEIVFYGTTDCSALFFPTTQAAACFFFGLAFASNA